MKRYKIRIIEKNKIRINEADLVKKIFFEEKVYKIVK